MASCMSLASSLGALLLAEEYPDYLAIPFRELAKMMTNFTTYESMQESEGPTISIRFALNDSIIEKD